MGGKKIYLTESQKQIIYESLLLDELPKPLQKQLEKNKTSLGKHPAFPDMGTDFDKKVILKRFQEVKEQLSDCDIEDMSEETLSAELSKLLSKVRKIEEPIRENLEKICYNTIVDMFSIPEDIINYSCSLVNKVDDEGKGIKLTPEDDEDETEFENTADIENTTEEVYKRRLINALIMGASMNLSIKLAKNYIGEVFELNPKLPELYSKIIKINNYLSFIKNDSVVINNELKGQMQGGIANVTLGNESTKSSIDIQAIIFPILLSESIRGFMELFAAHGLPKDRDKAQFVISKADALIFELGDQRMGPVLWDLLYNDLDETQILPSFFTTLVELPASEFHSIMREVFAKTREGKRIIQDIVDDVQYNSEYDDFEATLDKKRADIAVIEDEYMQPDELLTDELFENAAEDVLKNMGYKGVSFRDCVKLNNNKEAQNGGCSQGGIDKVVKIEKSKKKLCENHKNVVFERIGYSFADIVKLAENTIININDRDPYPNDGAEYEDEWTEPVFNSKEEFYNECYNIGETFNTMPDMIPIWRSIYVNSLKDINYENIGEAWSFERESAINFGNNHTRANVLLKAYTPHNNVDWDQTLKNYVSESLPELYSGDEENELVIINPDSLRDVSVVKTSLKESKQLSEGKHKEYGGLQWLKDHQVPLTDEEKAYFKKHDVLYFPYGDIPLIHKGKAKDEKDGEVYFAWTHRAWNSKPCSQKSAAVKMAKFIESTA